MRYMRENVSSRNLKLWIGSKEINPNHLNTIMTFVSAVIAVKKLAPKVHNDRNSLARETATSHLTIRPSTLGSNCFGFY